MSGGIRSTANIGSFDFKDAPLNQQNSTKNIISPSLALGQAPFQTFKKRMMISDNDYSNTELQGSLNLLKRKQSQTSGMWRSKVQISSREVSDDNGDLEVVLPEILEYQKPMNEVNPYDTTKLNWDMSMELSKMKTEYDCNQSQKQNMHEYL